MPPHDAPALASAIVRLLTDHSLADVIARAGHNVVRDRFCPSAWWPRPRTSTTRAPAGPLRRVRRGLTLRPPSSRDLPPGGAGCKLARGRRPRSRSVAVSVRIPSQIRAGWSRAGAPPAAGSPGGRQHRGEQEQQPVGVQRRRPPDRQHADPGRRHRPRHEHGDRERRDGYRQPDLAADCRPEREADRRPRGIRRQRDLTHPRCVRLEARDRQRRKSDRADDRAARDRGDGPSPEEPEPRVQLEHLERPDERGQEAEPDSVAIEATPERRVAAVRPRRAR